MVWMYFCGHSAFSTLEMMTLPFVFFEKKFLRILGVLRVVHVDLITLLHGHLVQEAEGILVTVVPVLMRVVAGGGEGEIGG